jgi:hypothetical protein
MFRWLLSLSCELRTTRTATEQQQRGDIISKSSDTAAKRSASYNVSLHHAMRCVFCYRFYVRYVESEGLCIGEIFARIANIFYPVARSLRGKRYDPESLTEECRRRKSTVRECKYKSPYKISRTPREGICEQTSRVNHHPSKSKCSIVSRLLMQSTKIGHGEQQNSPFCSSR